MTQIPEYQESIFDKMWEPLQRYQHAQINLQMLDRKQPRPVDYELHKRLFETQMIAAEDEMRKILYPNA